MTQKNIHSTPIPTGERSASAPTAPTAPPVAGNQQQHAPVPPQPGGQFAGQPYGYPAQGLPAGKPPLRAFGPILMIIGAALSIIVTFLPWNDSDYIEGDETWNGWDQIGINQDAGRVYGTLMLIAFIVVIAASFLVLVAAIGTLAANPAGKGLGVLGLVGALIGLVGTLGVLLGYLALGATDETTFAMWLYGVSFIPVLIGAIGVLSKKF